MSNNIDGPEWDPPELPGSDAPKIYVAGPGRFQQVVRTLSAAIAAAAIVWGVLWLGDESTKQTDLMNDQTELLQRQAELLQCSIDQSAIWNDLMLDETMQIKWLLDVGEAVLSDYQRFIDLAVARMEVTEVCTSDAYPKRKDN